MFKTKMLPRDVNLSPYSRAVAVRCITCKLEVLGDIWLKYMDSGNSDKAEKEKMPLGGSDDPTIKRRNMTCPSSGKFIF